MPYIDEIQIGSTSYDIKDKDISITLNGTATTSPSFYAPTTVGEADQVLTSNGSGAPTWITPAAVQVPNLTLNGVTAWNKSFYAPTAAGTANQILVSSGSGAPTWVSTIDVTAATSIDSSSADPITARGVYYGLPTINEVHTYNSSTAVYAPTTAGTADQVLISNGSGAPSWRGERVVASTTTPGSDCLIWIDIS